MRQEISNAIHEYLTEHLPPDYIIAQHYSNGFTSICNGNLNVIYYVINNYVYFSFKYDDTHTTNVFDISDPMTFDKLVELIETWNNHVKMHDTKSPLLLLPKTDSIVVRMA